MHMTDIQSVEDWAALERELHELTGMNAQVYNSRGLTFTGQKLFCNRLCPAIKAVPEALTGICATAYQAMIVEAAEVNGPVVSECDAGLMRICAPVYADGELVGAVAVCGAMPEGGEVESFFVDKLTGLGEDAVEEMASEAPVKTGQEAREIADVLQAKIESLLERS
jgi:ligand-binding sensor protein